MQHNSIAYIQKDLSLRYRTSYNNTVRLPHLRKRLEERGKREGSACSPHLPPVHSFFYAGQASTVSACATIHAEGMRMRRQVPPGVRVQYLCHMPLLWLCLPFSSLSPSSILTHYTTSQYTKIKPLNPSTLGNRHVLYCTPAHHSTLSCVFENISFFFNI